MLKSKLEKAPTKAEMEKKIEAWKTLNSVLVQSSAELMKSLRSMLSSKEARLEELKLKLESEGTEELNAEFLVTVGYINALKDILNLKKD